MSGLTARDLADDVLYLAPCRPAMIYGVPLQGFILSFGAFMVPVIIFGFVAALPGLLLATTSFYGMREAFSRDFNILNVVLAYATTRAITPGASVWGGASFDPLPTPPRSVSEALRA